MGGKAPTKKVEDQYYEERRAWKDAHPLPFELVNYCSNEEAMYIVAIPGTIKNGRRGYPERIDPGKLVVKEEKVEKLLAFLVEHKMKPRGKPGWWLSSYWG